MADLKLETKYCVSIKLPRWGSRNNEGTCVFVFSEGSSWTEWQKRQQKKNEIKKMSNDGFNVSKCDDRNDPVHVRSAHFNLFVSFY